MAHDDNTLKNVHWKPLLFLFLLLLIFSLPLVPGWKLLSGGDIVNQYIPYKHFWKVWLSRGVFPLWNPLIFSGRPFLGDIQLGLFYPLNLVHLVFTPQVAFSLEVLIHLAIALAGFYLFMQRILRVSWEGALVGTIVFVFSGFFLTRLYSGIVLFIFTAAWTPLVYYSFCRWLTTHKIKCIGYTAFLIALQFLAGAPQIAVISNTGLLLLFIIYVITTYKVSGAKPGITLRFLAGSLLIALLAAGLCAIQLLPTYEFMGYSFERGGKTAWEYATIDSLKPRFVLTWLFPDIFHSPTNPEIYWGGLEGYWEINAYTSIAALPFVILFLLLLIPVSTRRFIIQKQHNERSKTVMVITLCVMIIVGLSLAFGRYSPLYALFYHIVPFISKFRVPARWTFLYVFAISILAGMAIDVILRLRNALATTALRFSWMLLILLVLCSIGMMVFLPVLLKSLGLYNHFDTAPPRVAAEAIERCIQKARTSVLTSCTLATLSTLLALLFLVRRINTRTFTLLLTGIIIFDVFIFGIKFWEATPANKYEKNFYPHTPLISLLEDELHKERHRFIALDDVYSWVNDQNQMEIYPNRAMMYGLRDARGYDPLYIRSYGEFMNALAGRSIDKSPGALLFIDHFTNPSLLKLLNVKVVLTYQNLDHPGLTRIRKMPFGLNVYQNESCVGHAFIAQAEQFDGDKYQLLSHLVKTEVSDTVYTKQAPPSPSREKTPDNASPGSVRMIYTNPNSQTYEVNVRNGNILVFCENFYPGWKVFVDGKSSELVQVDHTFCGVFLPRGTHTVQKIYRPVVFYQGFALSTMSCLLLLFILLVKKRKGKTEI